VGIRNFPVITLGVQRGVTTGVIAAAGNIAIPTMSNSALPKYLALTLVDGAIGDWVVISPQPTAINGVAATGFAMNAQLGNQTLILNVHGFGFIGFEDVVGALCKLNLYPLEDF
jgi:hypothetical protein